MKIAIFLAMILFVIPLASAFDCSSTSDPNYCEQVLDSGLPESEKDELLSSLLYPYSLFPNHDFIKSYNLNITVEAPPDNTTIYNSNQIRNAWFSFLAIFSSVYENGTLYVPPYTNILTEHDHEVILPLNYHSPGYPSTSDGDCRRLHYLIRDDAVVSTYLNDDYRGMGNYTEIFVDSDGEVLTHLDIDTTVSINHYRWESYCCKRYRGACKKICHRCVYSHTTYLRDHVGIEESKTVKLYDFYPQMSLVVQDEYYNTTKGEFSVQNHSYFRLSFNASKYSEQKYYYDVVFEKMPYYYAFLEAHPFNFTIKKNIYIDNKTFFINNKENCTLFSYNHFFNTTEACNLTLQPQNTTKADVETKDADLSLLIALIVILIVIYVLYKLIRGQFRKVAIPIILFLLVAPTALAAEECGLTNLASCIPEKLYDFFLSVINAPLQPFLISIEHLLTAEVHIDIFHHVWSVVRYILSFFYLFLFVYAGIVFVTSSNNPIRRSQAKDMLKNFVIMIVLIQASFFLYELVIQINSIMSSSIYSLIDPHFFMLTADNIVNIGLQLIFTMSYVLVLFLTVLLLAMRYIVVSMGVILIPVALFCYFIPPLKGYGKFMLNVLGIFIFITFIDLLIILACSMIVEADLFEYFKILVMINCFSIINYTLYLAIKFALSKSSMSGLKDDVSQAAKYIAMLA